MSRVSSPVHVIASGPDYRDHKTAGSCPCNPIVGRDINEPARLVFIHQRQVEPEERETAYRAIGAEQLNGFGGLR